MNQKANETSTQQEHITITAAEMLRLRHLEMVRTLEDELDIWAKKRFRTALIAVSVFGFIGIQAIGYVLIDQLLGAQIEEAKLESLLMKKAAAQIESDAASATARAKEAFDSAEEQRRKVTTTISRLDMQTNAIEQQLSVLLAKSRAVSENVRAATSLDIQSLQRQIDTIAAVFEQYGVADQEPSKVLQQQENIKKESNQRRISFKENARYSIDVIYLANRSEDARSVIERMRNLGFEIRDLGPSGVHGSLPTAREPISILVKKYGINIVISPDEKKNEYVKTALSEVFPDWVIKGTVNEQYGSNTTNIVFWGLNIVLL